MVRPVSPEQKAALALRSRIGLLSVCIIALIVFLWLGQAVHTSRTQAVDNHYRAVVHSYASPSLTVAMRWVTQLGSTLPLVILTVVVGVALWRVKQRRAARMLAIDMAGALVLNSFLKDAFQRARPNPFFGILPPHTYSFPSGHSLFSFCFYGLLAVVVVRRFRSPVKRIVACAAASLIILTVGFSRVYLGVHYPTDVIGGWTVGLAWLSFVLAVYPTQRRA